MQIAINPDFGRRLPFSLIKFAAVMPRDMTPIEIVNNKIGIEIKNPPRPA